MADDSMDFKPDAISGAGVPTGPLESPPMDLGETPGHQELPTIREQPRPLSTSIDVTPTPPDMETSNPTMPEIQTRRDHAETPEWLLDPKGSGPQVYTEAGLESSRNAMEEGVAESPREPSPSWVTDRGLAAEVGNAPRAPSCINQGDPLMELGEGQEDVVVEEVPEVEQIQFQGLLAQLERLSPRFHDHSPASEDDLPSSDGEESPALGGGGEEKSPLLKCRGPPGKCGPCPLHVATGHGLGEASRWPARPLRSSRKSRGLLSAETDREDLLSLLRYEGGAQADLDDQTPLAHSDVVTRKGGQTGGTAETSLGPPEEAKGEDPCQRGLKEGTVQKEETSSDSRVGPSRKGESPPDSAESIAQENKVDLSSYPAFKEVPGPCDPEDLLEGVIFGAKYLGSTQLVSERNPPSSVRMAQAQEAVDRIKAPEGESQPMTEVDLFVSTQRIKVLTTDSQEAMMDHPLQTISYIADIGSILVLMARRKLPRRADTSIEKQLYKMICHVFHSADAQLIAQAIGQAFSVAYQHFLRASGIDPNQLSPRQPGNEEDDNDDDDDTLAQGEELYNGDLAHFSKQENCKKVIIPKQKGEILGVVIVESGWGSILPTVVIANLMHKGAAERSGKLSIGDRIMSVNETSLVGLPLAACQNIIRDLKNQTEVTLSVVHCPPVTTAIVRRPDTKYPLGFCVENGIICSLMRGGIAERGGIRVGHHIIEINGQSVVAMPHEKIIQILTQAVSEVRIKTMPASTYRLLTGQEQPVFL